MVRPKILEARGASPSPLIFWVAIFLLTLVVGMWLGYNLHQEQMFNGMVRVAEGLEGTIFNIEIDVNETLMVETALRYFNESGFFEGDLNSS